MRYDPEIQFNLEEQRQQCHSAVKALKEASPDHFLLEYFEAALESLDLLHNMASDYMNCYDDEEAAKLYAEIKRLHKAMTDSLEGMREKLEIQLEELSNEDE